MNILEKIIKHKKEEVHEIKRHFFFDEFKYQAMEMPDVKSFVKVLESKRNTDKISLIAEVKKASPSKGIIKENFQPIEIARSYEKAGASAISVLTDEEFFKGKIEYLEKIKEEVNIPVLRKDFIIDEFQIYQTRLIGADMILLIVSALEETQFKDFYQMSKEIGLDVLVEVHDKKEMEIALETEAKIIGINNRNLSTFETSLNTTIELIKDLDKTDRFFISESGIYTHNDILKLSDFGVSGVLVGESLMRQDNIEKAVKDLMGNRL